MNHDLVRAVFWWMLFGWSCGEKQHGRFMTTIFDILHCHGSCVGLDDGKISKFFLIFTSRLLFFVFLFYFTYILLDHLLYPVVSFHFSGWRVYIEQGVIPSPVHCISA